MDIINSHPFYDDKRMVVQIKFYSVFDFADNMSYVVQIEHFEILLRSIYNIINNISQLKREKFFIRKKSQPPNISHDSFDD